MRGVRRFVLAFCLVCVLMVVWVAAADMTAVSGQPSAAVSATPSPTASPMATRCPSATPEPFWVEPVVSPTELLTQTVTVRIGNGKAVTVTAESGVFTATGWFRVYGNPAQVTVDLLPNTVHNLWVQARVRRIEQWGCIYGGYILSTNRDRYGRPLVIEQRMPVRTLYLPLLLQLQ